VRSTILFLALLGSQLLPAGEPPLQPVTVCEALQNLAAYDGKVVALVGRFSSRQTGRWLGEQKCGQKLVTGDHAWPNAFWVSYDPAAAPKPPPVLAVDGVLLAQKLRQVKAATSLTEFRFGSSDYDSWAVIYGRIETRKQLIEVTPGGSRLLGFGYMESSPAQLACHGEAVIVFLNSEATTPSSR
jgi:hypothetical protein